MKELLTTHGQHDFVINTKMYEVKEDGHPKWVDEQAGIAIHKHSVQSVTFYNHEIKNGYPSSKAVMIELSPDAILVLADKIREIHTREIETVVDTDDLPW